MKVSINFSEIKPWFYLCIFRDELPIKLALPKAIRSAQTNQELTAIALQGQGKVSVCVCLLVCFCVSACLTMFTQLLHRQNVDPEMLRIRTSFSINYSMWMVLKGFPRPFHKMKI